MTAAEHVTYINALIVKIEEMQQHAATLRDKGVLQSNILWHESEYWCLERVKDMLMIEMGAGTIRAIVNEQEHGDWHDRRARLEADLMRGPQSTMRRMIEEEMARQDAAGEEIPF